MKGTRGDIKQLEGDKRVRGRRQIGEMINIGHERGRARSWKEGNKGEHK